MFDKTSISWFLATKVINPSKDFAIGYFKIASLWMFSYQLYSITVSYINTKTSKLQMNCRHVNIICERVNIRNNTYNVKKQIYQNLSRLINEETSPKKFICVLILSRAIRFYHYQLSNIVIAYSIFATILIGANKSRELIEFQKTKRADKCEIKKL